MTKDEKIRLVAVSLSCCKTSLLQATEKNDKSGNPKEDAEVLVEVWGDTQMLATQLTYFIEKNGMSEKYKKWANGNGAVDA